MARLFSRISGVCCGLAGRSRFSFALLIVSPSAFLGLQESAFCGRSHMEMATQAPAAAPPQSFEMAHQAPAAPAAVCGGYPHCARYLRQGMTTVLFAGSAAGGTGIDLAANLVSERVFSSLSILMCMNTLLHAPPPRYENVNTGPRGWMRARATSSRTAGAAVPTLMGRSTWSARRGAAYPDATISPC